MTDEVLFSSENPRWRTPEDFFLLLNKKAGGFTLDAAASYENRKVKRFICAPGDVKSMNVEGCVGVDAFSVTWKDEKVFINPPFNKNNSVDKWVRISYQRSMEENADVWILVPARTDTAWFHDWCWKASEILFIRGRLQFLSEDGFKKSSATFPSIVAHFSPSKLFRVNHEPLISVWDWKREISY